MESQLNPDYVPGFGKEGVKPNKIKTFVIDVYHRCGDLAKVAAAIDFAGI
ncbi:hypothetical protein ACFQZJ_01485 [Maribacter chungangensis]|uniref:Uncharacterized protein n=1 Tax=Maribacter chungangensis TaxID=1069117 RepID=A0ABW3AZW7_9FLAO